MFDPHNLEQRIRERSQELERDRVHRALIRQAREASSDSIARPGRARTRVGLLLSRLVARLPA